MMEGRVEARMGGEHGNKSIKQKGRNYSPHRRNPIFPLRQHCSHQHDNRQSSCSKLTFMTVEHSDTVHIDMKTIPSTSVENITKNERGKGESIAMKEGKKRYGGARERR